MLLWEEVAIDWRPCRGVNTATCCPIHPDAIHNGNSISYLKDMPSHLLITNIHVAEEEIMSKSINDARLACADSALIFFISFVYIKQPDTIDSTRGR